MKFQSKFNFSFKKMRSKFRLWNCCHFVQGEMSKRILEHIIMQNFSILHYCDVIMSTMASQITSLAIVYSTVYSGSDQRKHQSSASLAFVRGIRRWLVNSPHKGPVTRKMFPFDEVIMSPFVCRVITFPVWYWSWNSRAHIFFHYIIFIVSET